MQVLKPVVAVTGHRKLEHDETSIRIHIRGYLRKIKPVRVYIGMAIGFDLMVAQECLKMKIPYVACVPFSGQEKYWLPGQRKLYRELLEKAEKVEVLFQDGFASWKYLKRNEFMVNAATHVMAYWNGQERSGTGHAVKLADQKLLPLDNIFSRCKKSSIRKSSASARDDVPEED